MNNFLDKTGLAYLWSKIKESFVSKKELEDTEYVIAEALNELDDNLQELDSKKQNTIEDLDQIRNNPMIIPLTLDSYNIKSKNNYTIYYKSEYTTKELVELITKKNYTLLFKFEFKSSEFLSRLANTIIALNTGTYYARVICYNDEDIIAGVFSHKDNLDGCNFINLVSNDDKFKMIFEDDAITIIDNYIYETSLNLFNNKYTVSGINDILLDINSLKKNTIETIKVNNTALVPEDKEVNLQIKTINNQSLIGNGNITISGDRSISSGSTIIPFGKLDSTSTSTVMTATIDGITELKSGVCMYLMNGVVTSAAGYTININNLGAKPVYQTLAAATVTTTLFNINYTGFFVYNEERISGGCWDFYYGYDSNTNILAYNIRNNYAGLKVSDTCYRYRILFTSADGTQWVPSTTSTSTNATSARTVNQRPIDPFGPIIIYGSTSYFNAGAIGPTTNGYTQYAIALGYSFNRTGAALKLTYPAPVYIKCKPQSDGSAIIDADEPYVQALPTTEDGYIYIFLAIAYNATNIELRQEHPVYYYRNGGIRLWNGGNVVEKDEFLEPIREFEVWADSECTKRPSGWVNVVFVQINSDNVNYYDYENLYAIGDTNFHDYVEGDSFQVIYCIDLISDYKNTPLQKGDIIECSNRAGDLVDIRNCPKSFGNIIGYRNNSKFVTKQEISEGVGLEPVAYDDYVIEGDGYPLLCRSDRQINETETNSLGFTTSAYINNYRQLVLGRGLICGDININGNKIINSNVNYDLILQSETNIEFKTNNGDYSIICPSTKSGTIALTSDLYTKLSDLSEDSTHRLVTDTEKTNWNNKSSFSGNYNDLTNKPTIPTVNNTTINIKSGGVTLGSFTTNSTSSIDVDISSAIPTKTSNLTNDTWQVVGANELVYYIFNQILE